MAINSTQPIVEADGTMSQVMRSWMLDIENRLTALEGRFLTGSGTPEASVEADRWTFYFDTDATQAPAATPVLYCKVLADVGGDATKGWALIGDVI